MIKGTGKAAVYLCLFFVSVLLCCCGENTEDTERFTDEVRLPMTDVKSQGSSSFCWIYAMLATIETEHIGRGDSVSLSADYLIRQYLAEQIRSCFLSKGRRSIRQRGMATMLLHLLQREGVMPTHSLRPKRDADYGVVARRLTQAATMEYTLADVNRRADELLDEATGFLPKYVFMLGAEYTPLEFAHSVCRKDEYMALTSFTHHPFGQPFVLEVPDNQYADTFLNVPLDTLMRRIDRSLHAGHPVCWEGDISEPGFSFKKGVAWLPAGQPVTQQRRQREFESRRTTDDHCMALVGIARDRQGRRYYIAKNSWGTRNPYGGLMYLSEDYVRMKTICVLMTTESMVSQK
ncbi:MAG: cysteine protease [Prevotella sp.]|nr:cysteine protease [Prevotella sp.]